MKKELLKFFSLIIAPLLFVLSSPLTGGNEVVALLFLLFLVFLFSVILIFAGKSAFAKKIALNYIIGFSIVLLISFFVAYQNIIHR